MVMSVCGITVSEPVLFYLPKQLEPLMNQFNSSNKFKNYGSRGWLALIVSSLSVCWFCVGFSDGDDQEKC